MRPILNLGRMNKCSVFELQILSQIIWSHFSPSSFEANKGVVLIE